MKTEPTAAPFAVPTWSANGRTVPCRDGMSLCEMIQTDASITSLLCRSEVVFSLDIKEERVYGHIRSDCKHKNCEDCCKEKLAGNAPFKEEDIAIVLVCLRLSYNKPNRFKFVKFGGLDCCKAWKLQHDKVRVRV